MKLTIQYDIAHKVWFAFDGEDENEACFIGQGSTPEAACSDYWYLAYGSSADLTHDEETGWWKLSQKDKSILFTTQQEALDYAHKHNWQIEF